MFKLVLVGDQGTGKTAFFSRIFGEPFRSITDPTVGLDFKNLTVEVNVKRIKLQIWDTAGQERFRSISKQYWRDALGIFILYDIRRKNTLKNCESWLEDIRKTALEHVEIILVGNLVRVDPIVFIISKKF